MVRALFGDALVAELTEDEVKVAVAGDHSRTEAWQNAIDRLLGALQSGDLTTFAVQPAQDRRVRLSRAYWQLWIAKWRPFRTDRVDIVAADQESRASFVILPAGPVRLISRHCDIG